MKLAFRLPFEAHRHSSLSTPLRLLLATTTAFWMGTAQPQVTSGTNVSRQVTELRFRDFFSTPIGPLGLDLSDTLRQADGQTVRLTGYMVQQELSSPGRFMLTPRPVQMSEHADGEADDLPPATVVVVLDPSQADWQVPHVRGLVSVSGQLRVGRLEDSSGRVSWVGLQLGADAARSMNAFELTGYLHNQQHRH